MGAVVTRVEPGSIAARYGFLEGDEIITINGQLLRDIIDYYFSTSEHKLEINYVRKGFPRTTVIHKKPEGTLGLDFENEVFDEIITCKYRCMFCFVHQMPKKMRSTLYVKDDDYRLSFLHGSYITLTGLAENDLRRITALRLSPLYVSVHATDPDVRSKLMGSASAAPILKMLNKLKTHDIQCHTQVVVVPGVNDGKVLKKTLQDLLDLYPTIKTVAIVPVGLTKCRTGLDKLRTFNKSDAQQVYEIVSKFQEKAQKKANHPFFYMADEIYLLLDMEFPKHSHYGYFDQLGNGVGVSRKMLTEFNRRKRSLSKGLKEERKVWVVTGVLGEKVLSPLMEDFNKVKNLKTTLVPVKNITFGSSVTVTGLLGGDDILKEVKARVKKDGAPDELIIPDIVLRNNYFIDDMTANYFSRKLDFPVKFVPADAQGLIEGVLGMKKKAGDKSNRSTVEIELDDNAEPVEPADKLASYQNEVLGSSDEGTKEKEEKKLLIAEEAVAKHGGDITTIKNPRGSYKGKKRNFKNDRWGRDRNYRRTDRPAKPASDTEPEEAKEAQEITEPKEEKTAEAPKRHVRSGRFRRPRRQENTERPTPAPAQAPPPEREPAAAGEKTPPAEPVKHTRKKMPVMFFADVPLPDIIESPSEYQPPRTRPAGHQRDNNRGPRRDTRQRYLKRENNTNTGNNNNSNNSNNKPEASTAPDHTKGQREYTSSNQRHYRPRKYSSRRVTGE